MGKRGPKRDVEREEKMVCMYQSGRTLKEIGEEFGMSRERVRQLIKRHGVTGSQGGMSKKAEMKREQEEQGKEKRCIDRWGMTRRELKKLRAMHPKREKTPIGQFETQRNNAKKRGIKWNLTLKEWWEIWRESGLYNERGIGGEHYVMARYFDEGPYEVGNVKIIKCGQNSREYQLVTRPMRLTKEERYAHRIAAQRQSC